MKEGSPKTSATQVSGCLQAACPPLPVLGYYLNNTRYCHRCGSAVVLSATAKSVVFALSLHKTLGNDTMRQKSHLNKSG